MCTFQRAGFSRVKIEEEKMRWWDKDTDRNEENKVAKTSTNVGTSMPVPMLPLLRLEGKRDILHNITGFFTSRREAMNTDMASEQEDYPWESSMVEVEPSQTHYPRNKGISRRLRQMFLCYGGVDKPKGYYMPSKRSGEALTERAKAKRPILTYSPSGPAPLLIREVKDTIKYHCPIPNVGRPLIRRFTDLEGKVKYRGGGLSPASPQARAHSNFSLCTGHR